MSNFTNDNKPERNKRAVFRYFEAVYRKFKPLIVFNLMYFACVLPLICGALYLVCSFFNLSPETVEAVFFIRAALFLIKTVTPPVFIVFFVASLIAYGPLTAGFTYVMRELYEGKHVWYSELFSRAKSNFKQGLAIGIIDFLVLISLLNYLSADFSLLSEGNLIALQILRVIAIIASVIYCCMSFYTYTIAVTFELSLRDIFKNSLIFCVLGFFNNIVAFLVMLIALMTCTSTPRIDVILIATFFFSICRFSVIFATYPIVKKYMLSQKKTED